MFRKSPRFIVLVLPFFCLRINTLILLYTNYLMLNIITNSRFAIIVLLGFYLYLQFTNFFKRVPISSLSIQYFNFYLKSYSVVVEYLFVWKCVYEIGFLFNL